MKEEAETETQSLGIPEEPPAPNWRKDTRSILLLFFLYVLQGIPDGLLFIVPFLLLEKGVPYTDQARFSLAVWPFSLKVLYAPIVDCVYWKRMGRRKSWVVPLQYLIALFLVILFFTFDEMMDSVNVPALTAMFFVLNFLAASQDVAVDGWGLTMLTPENVAYASTCNAVGYTIGFVLGYSGFMALNSAEFANKFRSVPVADRGLITFPQFLLFWAVIFALTTTLILIFKREPKESSEVDDQHMNVISAYHSLWKIVKLRNIQIFAVFMLTVRIGMAATDSMNRLKMVEAGIPKEVLAFFSIPLIPVKLGLPILCARWTAGPEPMKLLINLIPVIYIFVIILPLTIFFLPYLKNLDTGEYPTWLYFFLFGLIAIELMPSYMGFVLFVGFCAKNADPAVGGTYMALLNTIRHIGMKWPSTLALWLVDFVSIPLRNDCGISNSSEFGIVSDYGEADANETVTGWTQDNGEDVASMWSNCLTKIDGYYVEAAFCLVVGILWLVCWGRPTILRLQARPRHTWRVIKPTM